MRRSTVLIDTTLVVLAAFWVVVGATLYASVRPEKIDTHVTPRMFGFEYEPLTLRTADGHEVAAWHVPARAADGDSAVIVLHGYPSDKGGVLAHAIHLAQDHDLLFVDFRYFGQSSGRYTTVGAREIEEVEAAADYLVGLGKDKIGVYGFSVGGAVALQALPQIQALDAAAAEASYANLDLMVQEQYRNFGPGRFLFSAATTWLAQLLFDIKPAEVSPLERVKLTNKPVLLFHSRFDEVIPFAHAELLSAALADNPQAEFWFPEAGIHGLLPAEYANKLSDFFGRHLR